MLVDLDLADGSGIEILHAARARSIECMVIRVFADEQQVSAAIRAGATAFVRYEDSDALGPARAVSDFGNTLTWAGISAIRDADGNPLDHRARIGHISPEPRKGQFFWLLNL